RYLASNLKAFNGNTAHALLGYNQGTGGAKQMLAGKIPMAEEGVNYVNKFKPGYLKKDSPIPSAQQYMAPATSDLIQMGKAGMNPQADDKFKTSALGNVTPVEPKQEEKKELTGAQKVSLIQNVLENLKVPQQQQVRAPAAPVQIRDGQVNMKMFQGPEDEGIQWKAPALVNVLG
ncbi:UNVERIFIED_CONTAM: lytic transglycosylase domain-containing protein, partial [Kocuria sp. CPCC 205274]